MEERIRVYSGNQFIEFLFTPAGDRLWYVQKIDPSVIRCEALRKLSLAYTLMLFNGTHDYPQLAAEERDEFEQDVSNGQWGAEVNDLACDCLNVGLELPNTVLGETSQFGVALGVPLPDEDRSRLAGVVLRDLHACWVRAFARTPRTVARTTPSAEPQHPTILPFQNLKPLVEAIGQCDGLSGDEMKCVQKIREGGGTVPLSNLAVLLGWPKETIDRRWSSLQKRLHTKLKRYGLKFYRQDNKITFATFPAKKGA